VEGSLRPSFLSLPVQLPDALARSRAHSQQFVTPAAALHREHMSNRRARGDGGKQKPIKVVKASKDETDERATARAVLDPAVGHSLTVAYALHRDWKERSCNELREELSAQITAVTDGDLKRPEGLLHVQAVTLDALFGDLTRLAYRNWNDLNVAERLLRLAFKAQSQSRATVETLATIKNPPMVFARQANVTSGPQQINNGVAREIQSAHNKLLEAKDDERLDTGATGKAIGSDSAMATVGAFDGPEDGNR